MRAIDAVAFCAAACGAFLFIILLATRGVVFLENDVFPSLLIMSEILVAGVAVAGVFALFLSSRAPLTLFLSPASILLGFAAWSYGFMLCERIAGPAAVVVGFSLGAIALVPIGLLAAVFAQDLQAAAILSAIAAGSAAAHYLSDRVERNKRRA